jgi:hypothetical protein
MVQFRNCSNSLHFLQYYTKSYEGNYIFTHLYTVRNCTQAGWFQCWHGIAQLVQWLWYGLDDSKMGVQFPTWAKISLITTSTMTVRPPSLLPSVYWELISARLNQLVHEGDHSSPSISELYIFTPIPEFSHLWVLCPYFLTHQRLDSNMPWKNKIFLFQKELLSTQVFPVTRWCMHIHFTISWIYKKCFLNFLWNTENH